MNLRQIHYFATVAELGHITEAADRLNITQPALSRQLKVLEDGLGLTLLRKVGRGVALTDMAERLLPHFHDLLAHADSVRSEARALAGSPDRTLTLIAPGQAIESFLASAVQAFTCRNPDVRLQLIEAAADAVQGTLERQQNAIAVAALPIGPQFRYKPVARGTIHAGIPLVHEFADYDALDVRDLHRCPVLVMAPGTLTRTIFQSACALSQIEPEIRHQSMSPRTLEVLAEIGQGIAVFPFTADVRSQKLKCIPLLSQGRPLSVDLAIIWATARAQDDTALDLIAEIEKQMTSARFLEALGDAS